MDIARQITAFLQNKPGRLSRICTALAREKVNIVALTIMDSKEHSVLRFVTDNIDKTREVLQALGVPYQEIDVLLVELMNKPGALARVCEQLAEEHINIDYAYCSAGAKGGKTLGVFHVSNMTRAVSALSNSGRVPSRQRQRPGRRPTYAR